jgi:hypothetical protein
MWGTTYSVTIQAINRNKKMSLLSEPYVFTLDYGETPIKPKPAAINAT